MSFDLAILDMQLPDGTGFDISEKLKNTGTAIIFLTVVDNENKIVRAFEDGADDYITKPFRLRELLARVKRTLNAGSGAGKSDFLTIGDARIELKNNIQSDNGYGIGLPLALSIVRGQNGATFTIKFYK